MYRRLNNPIKKKCITCGLDYDAHNWNTKYCEACIKVKRLSQNRKDRRIRIKEPIRKVCPICCRMFVITRGDREYCDRICYRKAGRLSTLLKRQKEIQESINTIKAFTR